MDIGIILDASTSVTRKNWEGTLKFVNRLSKIFTIGPHHAKFGVIRFSWFPSIQFGFSDNQYQSNGKFEHKVSTIRYTYGKCMCSAMSSISTLNSLKLSIVLVRHLVDGGHAGR